jgi:hypothetical protein
MSVLLACLCTLVPLYSSIHQAALKEPTLQQATDFGALIGLPSQNIGYPNRYWTYTKATRSYVSTYPEDWYVHQNGERVRDTTFHAFVMNPAERGWQKVVANNCPHYCYLDGMGTVSMDRTSPHMQWTNTRWVDATASLVSYVVATGHRAMPNSIGYIPSEAKPMLDAAGRGSTEAFSLQRREVVTLGRVWVTEKGDCGIKLAAYLLVKGRGDHFACYERGTLPWNIPSTSKGRPLGDTLGMAYNTRHGIRRDFAHGYVVVHADGTYNIRR